MSDVGQNHPEEHLVIPEPLKRSRSDENINASLPRKRLRVGVKPKPTFKRYRKSDIPDNHSSRLSLLPDDIYRKILTTASHNNNLDIIGNKTYSSDNRNSSRPRQEIDFTDKLSKEENKRRDVKDKNYAGTASYRAWVRSQRHLKPIKERSNVDPPHKYSKDAPHQTKDFYKRFNANDPTVPQWYIDTLHSIDINNTPGNTRKSTVYPEPSKRSLARKESRRISTI